MLALSLSLAAFVAWLGVLLLPSRPYTTRERIEADAGAEPTGLGRVAVLIPARNEAAHIARTLTGLAAQGEDLEVLIVDDESTDGTGDIARELARDLEGRLRIRVLSGTALPAGWGGKLWALQQGLEQVEREFTLLLDADIELAPGLLPSMLARAERSDAALVSVMAELRCRSFWERLLVPPFIFFFKLLYPFARVNEPSAPTAAAAGGSILVRTSVLLAVGGFEAIRGALIDDCSLAALVKRSGQAIWLGLSHSVRSTRAYPSLASFAHMVTRTAFTQLRYSLLLLLAVTALMLLLFVWPLIALVTGLASMPLAAATVAAALAIAAMCLTYLPTVRFYGLTPAWTLTLPAAATLFLAMTWGSALNYWRGLRAEWKDRAYASE
jgi:hopene-associated glycosyltransferase HpnB